MKIAMIGRGAVARYVEAGLNQRGLKVAAVLVRADRLTPDTPREVASVAELPEDLDIVLECAGHEALRQYGPQLLEQGTRIITVSIGALADSHTERTLQSAAERGKTRLHLTSGAIGALDCLAAGRVGGLTSVTYTGRKPPLGWKGSPAEEILNLDSMNTGTEVHFEGTARDAALAYPKNANVAAAVAIAGLGFDKTRVRLIADATVEKNVHEVTVTGTFGAFDFRICGNALPDNPRSSALAAMSVLSKLDQMSSRIAL
jgi:aspartate dehydrogenase